MFMKPHKTLGCRKTALFFASLCLDGLRGIAIQTMIIMIKKSVGVNPTDFITYWTRQARGDGGRWKWVGLLT